MKRKNKVILEPIGIVGIERRHWTHTSTETGPNTNKWKAKIFLAKKSTFFIVVSLSDYTFDMDSFSWLPFAAILPI